MHELACLRCGQFYPRYGILVAFPTSYVKVLSVGLKNHHEVFLPPRHFKKDVLVSERLPDGLYLSACLPESIDFPRWTENFMKVLHEILFHL